MATRMTDQVGRVLGGRYRLVAPIGTGASAHVFLADDVTLRRRVAVKVLHPALAADEAFLRRFRAEARAAAALSHPNLMAVYDWGEDDGPYLVLEYLGGGSLRSLLDTGVRLSPSQALVVGLEAARALDVAHRRGFVHRDIKPANLLFGEDARLRIADFGLARALSEAGWTEPGDGLVGTARYAAPEQARGGKVDGRADVYSLGLVLIESVTGEVPLTADGVLETMMARVDNAVPVPEAMSALTPILERVGQPDPEDRPDAAEIGRLLVAAASTMDRPEPLPLPGADNGAPGEAVEPAEGRFAGDDLTVMGRRDETGVLPSVEPRKPTRRRWPAVLVGLLVAAALVAAAVAAWTQLQPPAGDVPTVTGMTLEEATAAIEAAELEHDVDWRIATDEQNSESVKAGSVISQDPDDGDLDDGGRITLVVSLGPPMVPVPDLFNFTEAEARDLLDKAGLAVGEVEPASDETMGAGRVLLWRAEGFEDRAAELPKGTEVELVISSGPEPRVIPQLAGAPEAEARADLEEMGLVVTVREDFHDSIGDGLVIGTEPAAEAQVARDDTVVLVVSKGPDLVTVPDLRGRTYNQALSLLEDAGLAGGEVSGRGDQVRATDPEPGDRVRRGTEVDIFLGR